MKCSQCGAPIEENLKFCTQCGARVEQVEEESSQAGEELSEQEDRDNEQVEEKKERVLTRPIAKSQPKPKEARPIPRQSEVNTEMTMEMLAALQRGQLKEKPYVWENRKGLNGFAEVLLAIIVNPIASGGALYLRLTKKMTVLYMFIMVLLTSCVSYLIYITQAKRAAALFQDSLEYFFGYGVVQYILDEFTIQVLIMAVVSNILLILYMMALVMGFYRIILKVDIEWVECIQLMLLPIVISFFGQVAVLIISYLSIKAGLIALGVLALLVAILTILQFINRLGLSALSVYSLPPIYLLCSFVRAILMVQIIKGYI